MGEVGAQNFLNNPSRRDFTGEAWYSLHTCACEYTVIITVIIYKKRAYVLCRDIVIINILLHCCPVCTLRTAELAGAPRGVASTAWATSSGLRTSMLYKDTHHECLFLCDHNNERCAMCLRTVYRVQLKDHVGGMSMDHRPRTMLQQRQRIGLWSTRQIGHESDNDCALRACKRQCSNENSGWMRNLRCWNTPMLPGSNGSAFLCVWARWGRTYIWLLCITSITSMLDNSNLTTETQS